MAKEYRRTCKRCQTEWYLPKEFAKERMPNKVAIAGAKMSSAGASMSLISFSRGRKKAEDGG